MKEIERKTLLYKTKVEYGDYTANHVQGCAHGCKYPCYAMLISKRFGRCKDYEEWCTPKIVSNSLELLDKELPKYKGVISSVHLCFTTDPFMMNYPEVGELSIKIIKKINEYGIKCTTLTKGVYPEEITETEKINEYGISLVSLSEEFREQIEPFAAPYSDRVASLKRLHDAGYKTWVSIEPYPTPNIIEQNVGEILESVDFADKIIFGRMNYNKVASKYENNKEYYNDLTKRVIEFCDKNNIKYHIKKGTFVE